METNKITEDYVSFDTAKLLKKEGFDVVTDKCYILDDSNLCAVTVGQLFNGKPQGKHEIPAPTLQMACKWLREIHKLHILCYMRRTTWKFEIEEIPNCESDYDKNGFATYEQAVEEGIKYCLTNFR